MNKIDPYKHKERYLNWKESITSGIPNISKTNSDLILRYLGDMEKGINVSSKGMKGARSFSRLNSLRQRLSFFAIKFKEIYNLDKIVDIKEEQLIEFLSNMRNGKIPTKEGKAYNSVDTYAAIFKAFWHWHQKSNRKNGIQIEDITTDIDMSKKKPVWVYLTEEQIRRLCDKAKYEYKILIWFLYDTGIRAPTELVNIKVSDFHNDFKELNIRQEISKTFGRRIKLMLCSGLIKDYILAEKLKPEDYIFSILPETANRYLKRLAGGVFGEGPSPAGGNYSELTMYDFRHNSSCYWLPRYKSESAIKYRFGWKNSNKIYYYSEFLGMKDTIQKEDLLIDTTKTEIQLTLERSEKEKNLLSERLDFIEEQMKKILELTNSNLTKLQNKRGERG